ATQGPWSVPDGADEIIAWVEIPVGGALNCGPIHCDHSLPNARHIATANPETVIALLDRIAELERAQAEPVAWIPASTPPQIDIGEAEHCWVTVKSKRDGTVWVWDVYYCNLPILECDDDPHWAIYDESGERVSMIGWAEKGAHPDFCYFYSKLDLELHDVIAWQPVRRPVAYQECGAA
ncbi:ead/Ea22-like family protein, partial [Laribacter hongkongensis]